MKLTDGNEEFQRDISSAPAEISVDTVAEKNHADQPDCEVKPSSRKLKTFSVSRGTSSHVITDKKVLQSLLNTIVENIQKVSNQLQETSNRKCQLMQLVNQLTQEEIMLQRQLKKELDKENSMKQQLQDIEDADKEDWKVEEPCCKELDAVIQKDNRHALQISADKENNMLAENTLRETFAAKPIELKLFEGLIVLSNVNYIKLDSFKMESDEDTIKSSNALLKSSNNPTYSSDIAQADALTTFAEAPAEETERVECDDETTRAISGITGVETSSLSAPVTLQRKHVCSFCGERFWNASARQSHEHTHGKEFRCNTCGKIFSCRSGLINHKKTHTNDKPFACTLCDRCFKTNGSLKRHFRSHTREKRYACSVCSETFFYDHQRQVHMFIHTGKRPYVCDECGRGFSNSNCLTRHLLIHRGEKPFECDVCGKHFRQGNQVKAHKEMHGEKPYVCSRCGKRLGLGSFWSHMKGHCGLGRSKKHYECAVCDKKLSTKHTLEMHIRMVHMGEAPYVCDICYKEFGRHKDFRLHKKEHNQSSS